MVRVMIVEDEPVAMRFLKHLLETRCSNIEVVGQAEDGESAIEILKNTQIDIVVTDIQMAPMSGTQLALWISCNKPEIATLIVSGYSDFDYAKDAISAGVAEYLLKPVRPAEFASVMEKLCIKAVQIKREAREKWLTQVLVSSHNHRVPRMWQPQSLMLGVIRMGGVSGSALPLGWRFTYTPDLPTELAVVHARDELEICFVVPVKNISDPDSLASALSHGAAYYTAIYIAVSPGDDCPCLPEMLAAAQKIALLGKSQVIKYTGCSFKEPAPSSKEQSLLRNLRYVIANSQLDKIKTNLIALFSYWEDVGCVLAHITPILTGLLQLATDYAPPGNDAKISNIPDFASQICQQAPSPLGLLQKTWAYCERLYKPLERSNKNGQLISQIENYINEHMSEQLSTQQICGVFRISVSHLTQLFRHFVKMTFVEYVTRCRIDEAKRLMTEIPDMPIKSVAIQLGFSDQFYFSKVFRSIEGVSPSEFKANLFSD